MSRRDSSAILEMTPPPADERICYGPGRYHFGDLRLPDGNPPYPVVVNIHGGFWRARYDLTHAGHLCAALTAEGYATWNIEYRRVGHEGGGWPGTFQDVARGVDHVRVLAESYHLDLARVVVMGHSAGGQLALWVAARHRLPPPAPIEQEKSFALRGVISLAGVVDLRWASERRLSDDGMATDRLMGGPPADRPWEYELASPYNLLPLGLPQILLHGTEDRVVPHEISRRYVERARSLGDDATLITLPGAGHFDLVAPGSEVWGDVLESVQRLITL
jgi:acetyl esterase/lipase